MVTTHTCFFVTVLVLSILYIFILLTVNI